MVRKMQRKRVGFGRAMKAGADYWDWGDDPVGLMMFVVIPATGLWFFLRGVPINERTAADTPLV